eukprot:761095-Hanusia_phi.AAC.2
MDEDETNILVLCKIQPAKDQKEKRIKWESLRGGGSGGAGGGGGGGGGEITSSGHVANSYPACSTAAACSLLDAGQNNIHSEEY